MNSINDLKNNFGYYSDKCITCGEYDIDGYTSSHGYKCLYYGSSYEHNNKCSHYTKDKRRSRSECVSALERLIDKEARYEPYFIITAISKILNLEDDSFYYKSFKSLYKKLALTENGLDMLSKYDKYGKIIADHLLQKNDKEFCSSLIYMFLNNFVYCVKSNDYKKALDIYINMMIYLSGYFNIIVSDEEKDDMKDIYSSTRKRML